MKLKILTCIAFLSFFSCTKVHQNNDESFQFYPQIEEEQQAVSFKDVVADSKMIALETTSDCLLKRIQKTVIQDERIYVQTEDGIFCFSLDGRFIFSFGNRGKGPGEFIAIGDFSVSNGKVFLYDRSKREIIVYDGVSGSYIEEIDFKSFGRSVCVLEDQLFIDRGMLPNDFLEQDNNSKLIVSELYDQENLVFTGFEGNELSDILGMNKLIASNDKVYWVDPVFNQVFKWNGQSFDPYIWFDFGKRNVSISDIHKSMLVHELEGKALQLSNVYENDEFITGQIMLVGKSERMVLYNKKKDAYLIFEKTIGETWEFAPVHIQGVYSDFFYCVYDASNKYVVEEFVKSNRSKYIATSGKDKELIDRILNVKNTDNPFIFFYRFKE